MELREYFQSYEDYFWEWTTDEDIHDETGYHENNLVSIPNVGPIVYRAYMMEILKELKNQGLPPFGSLLLVLYAIQDGYLNLDGAFYHLKKHSEKIFIPHIRNDVEAVIKLLENLKSLGSYLKKGQNKIILLQTLFKNCHNRISEGNTELILNEFEKKPYKIAECAVRVELTDPVVIKDIKTLALIHQKFPTTDSLIEAVKGFSNGPELEEEVVEEETTVETDKDFIQELIDDPKTFQVGSLIKRIWSGLKIPMLHLSPGEQPIGGISDMTNKGELHRMLLSEFANEDEVFMSRIANNEALYIQREIPPEENIFERVILIDTSLKNWGTPKVLAFASAIAIIKHPKATSQSKVFLVGQEIISVSLDTVPEVITQMNQVSPVLEVSETLERFFREHTEKDLEIFFITHHENLENNNVQRVIQENRDSLKFIVTTSAEGELNFFKHHRGTRKHIQKINLPLSELWAYPPKRRHDKKRNTSSGGKKTPVPQNYPILFPTPVNRIATFLYEGEFFILSAKKQLLKTYLSDNYYNKNYYDHYKTHRGSEVLFEDISIKPRGQFILARNRKQDYVLCQYQPDKKILSKLNLNTKEYSELNIIGHHIPLNFRLIYFDKSFYLYEEGVPSIFKISIEGIVSIESVKRDDEIDKHCIKVGAEIGRLVHSGIKILSNINRIGINSENNLVIAQNELTKVYDNSVTLYKNKYDVKIAADQNKNKFTFSEGSEVIVDARGMLTFKSSNKDIPEFYIPSTEHGFLSLATEMEFGGSEYYLPETTLLKIRKMEDMYSEYLDMFIEQILRYGI
ncbi:hypothetical protein [Chryseobacterium sp.]|uniref:hypothetical protein n=1 Tax=Chryseobacterium sp. TaxID=1871047 RepID=UPI0025C34B9E|nr:hypothetical protein [Chryseobacterium sp.]